MSLLIQFKDVSYEYAASTPFAFDALRNVNVGIEEGKITAIIGPTGRVNQLLFNILMDSIDLRVVVFIF